MTGDHPQETFVNAGLGRHFTLVLSKALRDERLSWRAKGILAGCLSHSADFSFTRDWIVKHGTEGRDAVIAALKELRELGYLRNKKIRNKQGQVTGERYEFTDRPSEAEGQANASQRPENQRPENQRPEKPDAGFPGRNRRSNTRKTIQERTPHSPPCKSAASLALPDWLEPHRLDLEQWQANRRRAHPKLEPGITKSSMRGLVYARDQGVLEEYCSYASEKSWQSLGFIGHQETIDKIKNENSRRTGKLVSTTKINYTLS